MVPENVDFSNPVSKQSSASALDGSSRRLQKQLTTSEVMVSRMSQKLRKVVHQKK